MTVASDILSGVLGALFILSGGTKLVGIPMARTNFEHWRYPQWFRIFTGGWEFIGGALLLVGIFNHRLAIVGAVVVGLSMIGAVYTHVVRVPELKVLPAPIVLLGLAVATAVVTAATL